MRIYVNKIENRITFTIKTGYSLELLTPETMKVIGSNGNKLTKDKNDENVPHLEITEVVLIHFNIVSNDYHRDSTILYTFVPSKSFDTLLKISQQINKSTNHIFLKTFNSELQEIKVWFTDLNSQLLEDL